MLLENNPKFLYTGEWKEKVFEMDQQLFEQLCLPIQGYDGFDEALSNKYIYIYISEFCGNIGTLGGAERSDRTSMISRADLCSKSER